MPNVQEQYWKEEFWYNKTPNINKITRNYMIFLPFHLKSTVCLILYSFMLVFLFFFKVFCFYIYCDEGVVLLIFYWFYCFLLFFCLSWFSYKCCYIISLFYLINWIISVSISHLNKFNYPIVVSNGFPAKLNSILSFLLNGSQYYFE